MPEGINFWALQLEKAPETGTLHAQMYVCLKKPSRATGVQAIIPHVKHMHVEICKGNHQQSLDYVTKSDSAVPEEEGGWRRQDGQGTLA